MSVKAKRGAGMPSEPPPFDERESVAALEAHAETLAGVRVSSLFSESPDRFVRHSRCLEDLLVDWSKHRVTDETLRLLMCLARESGVEPWRDAMFAGARINRTEDRAVLHVALRDRSRRPLRVDGLDVPAAVEGVLAQMRAFCEAVRSGAWRGHTGAEITDIVNIGIGGSDLGPAMVTAALRPLHHPRLRAHFVSNVDGAHLAEAVAGLDRERTLFIVASKTFTTQETLANAQSARAWLLETGWPAKAVARHFVAVSTNKPKVTAFGIDPKNMFRFWDWVGGRYSVWSAIGLPVALMVGMEGFEAFLDGAYAMDEHFRTAPLEDNLPVILALLGVWWGEFYEAHAHAVLPYGQQLARFPAYLQQLDMESNGKGVGRDGRPVRWPTGPVVFGEPGTNGQHAFYQLLHQGTRMVPADFIGWCRAGYRVSDAKDAEVTAGAHQTLLLSNFIAQTQALMEGRSPEAVRAAVPGVDDALLAHRVFLGDRPVTTLLFEELDPRSLGRLLALYEHKVFVQGVIWGLYSFDQWGVELGKSMAGEVLPELLCLGETTEFDPSTNGIINHYKRLLDQL